MSFRSLLAVLFSAACIAPALAHAEMSGVRHRHVTVDNIDIFYREAGDPALPAMLLLHGFPSSSTMFRDLMPLLADRFHLVAPDYPGMGMSEAPPADRFMPSFDNLAKVMGDFTAQLNLSSYILFMQDFGGPVGMRMATNNPERVAGIIIQNTPVSLDGWNPARLAAVQANAGPVTPEKRQAAESRVVQATSDFLHKQGAAKPNELNPDAWAADAYPLNDPQKRRIMTDLQLDIPTSLALYPAWQNYLKARHPPTLVVWGRNDPIFSANGGDIVKALIPAAQIRYYDTGHFALEEKSQEIAQEIKATFTH